jgi:homoserine O-acetyltransferase
MELKKITISKKFHFELGGQLDEIEIGYHTFGKLNNSKDNVIWVIHALTANSNVFEWWPGLFGENDFYNPNDYFIICANNLGSCYGTTGPVHESNTEKCLYHEFPFVTIRDMVNVHELLRQHLGIEKIHTIIGGSQGAQQIIEWNILQPKLFERSILIATNAKHSPWGIAFNESQRMAIFADESYQLKKPDAGQKGLAVARSIALISYRNYLPYAKTQSEKNNELVKDFKASSYQRYQGEKLVKRFNTFSYITLINAMDSHNVGRGRTSIEDALQKITASTLIISISNDLLFPPSEQEYLHQHIKNSKWVSIYSDYGHDGFLLETKQLTSIIKEFYKTTNNL